MKKLLTLFQNYFENLNYEISHPLDSQRLMECALFASQLKIQINISELIEDYFDNIIKLKLYQIDNITKEYENYYFAFSWQNNER